MEMGPSESAREPVGDMPAPRPYQAFARSSDEAVTTREGRNLPWPRAGMAPTGGAPVLRPPSLDALLPARERPDGLPGLELRRPDGDELPLLDLLDQHLVLVLVGVPVVV